MKLLAIETSSSACSVGLSINDKIKVIHEVAPMQQAQTILPIIEKLLKEENIFLNQLDALCFGCGPGSFTGVRIATSVIQGLGFALNLPVIPISSLAAAAQTAFIELGWKNLLVVMDARIQEVYSGIYQVNSEGYVELLGKEKVGKPLDLDFAAYQSQEWHGIGNGWSAYKTEIPFKPALIDAECMPSAAGVLALAKFKFLKRDWIKASEAIPTYLRDDVAKKSYL